MIRLGRLLSLVTVLLGVLAGLSTPQTGSCLHCRATVMPLYEALGDGDVVKGFEQTHAMSFEETNQKLEELGHHNPLGCVDCHDPDSMSLRVTRPAFIQSMPALAGGDGAVPHLPSVQRWLEERAEPGQGQKIRVLQAPRGAGKETAGLPSALAHEDLHHPTLVLARGLSRLQLQLFGQRGHASDHRIDRRGLEREHDLLRPCPLSHLDGLRRDFERIDVGGSALANVEHGGPQHAVSARPVERDEDGVRARAQGPI
ncbi:MAG: ammonia-forming cytochrome c nitrite reductase subunit c552 [bacterium]|nr:ammonia-forming cytochrome c nitrite reductase subunit c552 [bacterium]